MIETRAKHVDVVDKGFMFRHLEVSILWQSQPNPCGRSFLVATFGRDTVQTSQSHLEVNMNPSRSRQKSDIHFQCPKVKLDIANKVASSSVWSIPIYREILEMLVPAPQESNGCFDLGH
jgi:hypothetical protein